MSDLYAIIGLGATGFSCAHFLKKKGQAVAIMDTRLQPPCLTELEEAYTDIPLTLGRLDEDWLRQATTIVISPGISIAAPLIQEQIKRGVPIIGDIELFARHATAPIMAVTGTNAKSTVTTLLGKMAAACSYRVEVGGNLGTPALNLLNEVDLYVLELSSFQLETTYSLNAAAATILNITPDHMDRYQSLEAYKNAKQRIYQGCQQAICNKDDLLTDTTAIAKKTYFTLSAPNARDFGLVKKNNAFYLAHGNEILLCADELPLKGKHYYANALAALAMGHAMNFPLDKMLQVLRDFKGLPHRCEFIRELNGVSWFNDSKGTNVGATEAAIQGLGTELTGKLVLIAGGVGKGADFKPLVKPIQQYVKHVVLIGEAATDLEKILKPHIPLSFAKTMDDAIDQAKKVANNGDAILLSPACASFDMFKHFEHRGEVFTNIVKAL